MPPGIVGGVCAIDVEGAYSWEPFTGVVETPERKRHWKMPTYQPNLAGFRHG